MPLIKPEIQNILRKAGLDTSKDSAEDSESASEKLTRAGLSLDEIALKLFDLADGSGNDALRLRALETGLKVHGALKDNNQIQIPSFNIIIQSAPSSSSSVKENPTNNILFPRQSLLSVDSISVLKEPS